MECGILSIPSSKSRGIIVTLHITVIMVITIPVYFLGVESYCIVHYNNASAPCRCGLGSKFMISHMPRPRLESRLFAVWFRYYSQPAHVLPTVLIPFTLGVGALRVGPSSMEFGGPVRNGLVVFTLQGDSNQFELCPSRAVV